VQWSSGPVVQWSSGPVVQWSSGHPVGRRGSGQWCSGALEQRCRGAGAELQVADTEMEV
jgi:hypothetical protein